MKILHAISICLLVIAGYFIAKQFTTQQTAAIILLISAYEFWRKTNVKTCS